MLFLYANQQNSDHFYNSAAAFVQVLGILIVAVNIGYLAYNCVYDCKKACSEVEPLINSAPSV